MLDFVAEYAGYIYFFAVLFFTIVMCWYIWHLYSNKDRSKRYEEYSNLVLRDSLEDAPVEAIENRVDDPQTAKKG